MSPAETHVATDPIEAWLTEAVERLVRAIDPERILLFGSFAKGQAGRRSDIDLIVVWNTDLGPLDRIGLVLELLAGCSPTGRCTRLYSNRVRRAFRTPFPARDTARGSSPL
jgi:predicted nucleotidyltransferase